MKRFIPMQVLVPLFVAASIICAGTALVANSGDVAWIIVEATGRQETKTQIQEKYSLISKLSAIAGFSAIALAAVLRKDLRQ